MVRATHDTNQPAQRGIAHNAVVNGGAMAARGRSNQAMLARMSRILLLLRGHPGGLSTEDLLDRVGYGSGSRASRLRTLHRDLAALAAEGWRIDTLATANTSAVRVLRTVDNRFATLFTAAERAELARAAACAGPEVADALADDLGRAAADVPPFQQAFVDGRARLAVCQVATADRCEVTFSYGGSRRVVHPVGLLLRPAGWYLRALDTGDGKVKSFHVDRMRGMSKGEPGTARPVPEADLELQQPVMDPMALPVHDPISVEVDTDTENLPDVLTALARQGHTLWSPDPEVPDRVRVAFDVTNTEAFIARLYQLGRRVRLIGPEPIRAQVRGRLRQVAGPA